MGGEKMESRGHDVMLSHKGAGPGGG